MAAACGLTIIKRFPYRGDTTEEFSNQYWFTGGAPADGAAWLALANAVIAQEKTCYPGTTTVVAAYGYDSDVDGAHAVYTLDLHAAPVAGTLSYGTGTRAPGDAAVWVRWKTSRLNTKGKAIYLRKYFHPATVLGDSGPDTVTTAQVTALNAFGTKCYDGSLSGTRTITARGHTDTILSRSSSANATTRTLKRRGKRPGA
jgi:hypothetical protein